MKTRLHLPLIASVAFAHTAAAQDIIKANNKNTLNLTASWFGGNVPTAANTAVWNATSSGTFLDTVALGANLSWQGLRIDGFTNTYQAYTITGTNALTLGSSGISLSGINLTLSHPLAFSSNGYLQLNTNSRGVTFNGPVNLGGNTLTMISGHESRFINGTGPFSNGTLRYTSGTHNGHGQFNAASGSDFKLLGTGGSRIIFNHLAVSNPLLDIDLADSSGLSLGVALDNQTVQIGNLSGTPGSWISPNYAQVSGNPPVVRTLAVNQRSDGSFPGAFSNSNNNRAFGLTKSGDATLSLTHPFHLYSGTTTVQAGTLKLTGEAALCLRPNNSTPITVGYHVGPVAIQGGLFHYDSSISQIITGSFGGTGTLLKTRPGFLTLEGDGSGFTGQANVQQGRLVLANAFNGHVSLASGASLGGAGTGAGNLTTAADTSIVLNGGATTTARTFDGVILNGPTYFEFLNPPQGGTTYDVLGYGNAGITNVENLQPRARGVLSHDTANKKIVFTAQPAQVRTWNSGDGVWNNQGLLTHWAEGDQVFMQGDQAVFGSIPADTTITLGSHLAPSVLTVQHPSNTYRFVGSQGFTGTGTIHKNSTGILEVGAPCQDFKGILNINGGVFCLIDGGSWGVTTINNNAALEIDSSTDFTFLGNVAGTGTLAKRGSSTVTIGGGPNDNLSLATIYNINKVNENPFTGNVTVQGGCLRLNKPTALGLSSTAGAKIVTVTSGGQIDFNGFAPQGRDNRIPARTYSFRIAGAGPDGAGALVNHGIGLGQFAGVLNLELTADATVGGGFNAGYYDMGSGTALKGVITGNGYTLTKVGLDQVGFSAPANNITLIVEEGTLFGEANGACFGGATGSVTVHGGATLKTNGAILNPAAASGPMIIPTPIAFHDGATLLSTQSPAIIWSGPITLGGILNVNLTAPDYTISGTVSGNGGIVKTGARTLTLSAANTYTGPTTVNEGAIAIQQPYLSNNAAVTVATGATLQLDFTGTDIVGSLTLGGVAIAPGETCDAVTHPGLLAGTGKLQVGNSTSDYLNWSGSSGYNLSGGPDGDDDFDGLTNFNEYAFGLDPTSGASARSITVPDSSAGIFTYTRRKPSLTQLAYSYESSVTLSAWESFTPPLPEFSDNGDPVERITVSIPAALLAETRLFLRVKARNP